MSNPTNMEYSKLVRRNLHVEKLGKNRNQIRLMLEGPECTGNPLKVNCIVHISCPIQPIIRLWWIHVLTGRDILIEKTPKKNVKHSDPGKGATHISLACAKHDITKLSVIS